MSFKKILIGTMGVPSILLLASPQAQATARLVVAVDHSLATVMEEMVSRFVGDYPAYDGFITVADSASFKDEVLSSGAGAAFDLFLSPNGEPSDLYNKYQFDQTSLPVGPPFRFATDSVVLYSGWMKNVDISGGFPIDRDFMIADPVADAYGAASAKLLAKLAPGKSRAAMLGHVKIAPDIGGAWSNVELTPDAPAIGFVAKSSVCIQYATGGEIWNPGSSHYEFPADLQRLGKIDITGVAINKDRTKEEKAQLNAFIEYIKGKGPHAAHSAFILKSHCYAPSGSGTSGTADADL